MSQEYLNNYSVFICYFVCMIIHNVLNAEK